MHQLKQWYKCCFELLEGIVPVIVSLNKAEYNSPHHCSVFEHLGRHTSKIRQMHCYTDRQTDGQTASHVDRHTGRMTSCYLKL